MMKIANRNVPPSVYNVVDGLSADAAEIDSGGYELLSEEDIAKEYE